MDFLQNIFFITTRLKSGIGVYLPEYQLFVITENLTVNSKKFTFRNKKNPKKAGKIIFRDIMNNISFAKPGIIPSQALPFKFPENYLISEKESYIIFYINYFGEIKKSYAKVFLDKKTLFPFLEVRDNVPDGSLVINDLNETVGMVFNEKNTTYLIPSGVISATLKEFSKNNYTEAIRCPYCKKIIDKSLIINRICPNCKTQLDDKVLGEMKDLKKSKITTIVEDILKELGYDPEYCTLNENFWEIQKGSATIFIRYSPEKSMITAFSILPKVEKNQKEIYNFLLEENRKIKNLSFALEKDRVFLASQYIYEEGFTKETGKHIFSILAEKSDYYDDIIIKMQQK